MTSILIHLHNESLYQYEFHPYAQLLRVFSTLSQHVQQTSLAIDLLLNLILLYIMEIHNSYIEILMHSITINIILTINVTIYNYITNH